MSFSTLSKMRFFSFFLLLFVVVGAFALNGALHRQATHAVHASSPATVYIGSGKGLVYAITANSGQVIWKANQKGQDNYSSPAVVGNTVYIGSIAPQRVCSQCKDWSFDLELSHGESHLLLASSGWRYCLCRFL